jgi:hypothetical protein
MAAIFLAAADGAMAPYEPRLSAAEAGGAVKPGPKYGFSTSSYSAREREDGATVARVLRAIGAVYQRVADAEDAP